MSLVVVNVSAGSTTTTLPLISSVPGGMITIKDSGSASASNTITILTTAGNTFETGTYIINTPLGYITFLGIDTRWRVIGTSYPNVPVYTSTIVPTPGTPGPTNATLTALTVSGQTSLQTLSTIGQAVFFSSVQVQGGLSVFSSITARNINFTGLLTSNGTTFSGAPPGINSAGSVGINSASNASYSLLVTGNQSNTGTLNVTGLTTLVNSSNTGTLGVAGATTLAGTLNVTGLTTLVNSSNTGTLGVAGATTLVNSSNTGTLGVAGATTMAGTLNVTGLTTHVNSSNTGIMGVAGATTLTGTLGVTGLTTLVNSSNTGTLGVAGNISLSNLTFKTNLSSISLGINSGGSQASNAIAIGIFAGSTLQAVNAVAVGTSAGQSSQSADSVAIGNAAGSSSQGASAVAIGLSAASTLQGSNSVAIGAGSGQSSQGINSVAVGRNTGLANQGAAAVAIGLNSGFQGQGATSIAMGESAAQNFQGQKAVAIGYFAGLSNQGASAVAIGNSAGVTNQAANSININASGTTLNNTTSGLFVNPVRFLTGGSNIASYNVTTSEVFYSDTAQISSLILSGTFSANATGVPVQLSPATSYNGTVSAYATTTPITLSAGFTGFNGNGSVYVSANDLLLKGQDLSWPGSNSAAASILIQSGRSVNGAQNSDNQIQFNTGGAQRGFFSENGLTATRFQANGGNMTARIGGVYNYDNVNYLNYSSSYYTINWIPGAAGTNTFDTVSQGCAGIICSAQSGNAFINFYVNNMSGASNAPTRVGFFNTSGLNVTEKITVGNFGNVAWNAQNRGEVRCTGDGNKGIAIDPANSRIMVYDWNVGSLQPLSISASSLSIPNINGNLTATGGITASGNSGSIGVPGTGGGQTITNCITGGGVTLGKFFSGDSPFVYGNPSLTLHSSNAIVAVLGEIRADKGYSIGKLVYEIKNNFFYSWNGNGDANLFNGTLPTSSTNYLLEVDIFPNPQSSGRTGQDSFAIWIVADNVTGTSGTLAGRDAYVSLDGNVLNTLGNNKSYPRTRAMAILGPGSAFGVVVKDLGTDDAWDFNIYARATSIGT